MIASPPMMAGRLSVVASGAVTCAAVAAWVSFGALSFVDVGDDAAHVGLLPSPVWLALLLGVGGAFLLRIRPAARTVAPLWLSAVALLPWLPLPLPLSVFIWTGNLLLWLWAAIAVALAAPSLAGAARGAMLSRVPPRRAASTAGIVAAVCYGLATWTVAPAHPEGDEPHYLIIAQSILQDGDLKIDNNHEQGDYVAYLDRVIKPDFLRRGTDGRVYSIHAPGLPMLIAPAFALFGYHGVLVELVLLGAAASALVWLIAWRVTGDAAASWFSWAAVALSAPFFFHASSVFPDGVGAALTLVALLPLVDSRARTPGLLLVVGAALAALPWLHSRFALIAASAGLVIVARLLAEPSGRVKRVIAFSICPAVSAAAWFLFFQIVYGTPNPAVVYGGQSDTALANLVRGVPGHFFDQQFGLIPSAPVYLCAFAGLVVMMRRGSRRLAFELLLIGVPYFLLVSLFFMWWAGTTPPARFLVPLTLVAAVPVAAWFAAVTSVAVRMASLTALLVSLFITFTMASVDRGAFVFNFRDGMSKIALWLSPVVDLTKALPSLFQNPPSTVVWQAAVWLLGATLAVAVGAFASRRRPTAALLGFGLTLEVAVMAAVSTGWRASDAVVVTPHTSGPALLQRYDADGSQIAVQFRPFRRISREELPGRIVLARAAATAPGTVAVARLPAGVYEVAGTSSRGATGRVRVRTDRVSGPIAEWNAADLEPRWTRSVSLPIAVTGLQVEPDAAARSAIADVSIRAASVAAPVRGFESREARRAARYGPAVVFLLGGNAWVEPGGTWVAGGSNAEFAIAPDPQSAFQLFLRNGPVENVVTLESAAWREALALKPGEERSVQLPLDGRRRLTSLVVAAASGFRPADFDPQTTDIRFLGVWIETR